MSTLWPPLTRVLYDYSFHAASLAVCDVGEVPSACGSQLRHHRECRVSLAQPVANLSVCPCSLIYSYTPLCWRYASYSLDHIICRSRLAPCSAQYYFLHRIAGLSVQGAAVSCSVHTATGILLSSLITSTSTFYWESLASVCNLVPIHPRSGWIKHSRGDSLSR